MFRSAHLLLVPVLWTAACSPDLSDVSLEPAAPLTAETLRLNVQEVDVSVTWLVDGDEVGDLRDALEVSAERTSRGETWTAHVWGGADADRTREPDAVFETLIGNTAPTITAATVTPEVPTTTEDLRIALVGEDADGDRLFSRVQWFRNGEPVKGRTGERLSADATARGETWMVQAWMSDGDIEVGPQEVSVMIDNVEPVAQRVTLSPRDAFEDSELVATPTGTDEDGDAITWTFAWYVDDAKVDGATHSQLDGASFDKGQVVVVEAIPSDGFVSGAPVRSEGVLIGNTAPTASDAAVEPQAPTETDTLSCVGESFADLDGDAEGWLVAWTVDGVAAGTSVTLDGSAFDRDQVIGCTLTPFDGEDAGEAVVATPITVLNTAPVLASAAIDLTAPTTTDTLSAVLGTADDVDGDDVSYTYAWTVDGTVAGTEATLPGSAFARDAVIGLTVTPTDDADAGLPVVATAVTVVNSAPVISAVTLSPSAPATEDAITASVSADDADGDGMTYTYTWSVEGAAVSETSATLPSSAFAKGDAISLTVVANDGTVDSAALSATVTIANTPPTLASASLSPSTVREGDTLTCTPSGFDDVDGDSASYTYAWTVDGTDAGVTTATLDSGFGRGDEVVCTVTPSDGTDDGTAVTTSAITIANTAPSIASVALSSTTPGTEDDVVATASGITDVDGDTVALSWVWTVNGSTARTFTGTAATDTLPASESTKGDLIVVSVTPSDDADSGSAVSSATATVQNTAPVISAVSLSPSAPATEDAITASVTADDADGDGMTYAYTWSVEGVAVSETSATLASSAFSKGEEVSVSVVANDGTDDSAALVSAVVTIANTAPVGGSASVAGSTPDDDLVCSLASVATDADGDSLTYAIGWELDGVAWTGSVATATRTGDTISSADTEWGDEWQCIITVDDGDDTIDVESAVQGIIPIAPDVEHGTSVSTTPARLGGTTPTGTASDACASGEFLVGMQAELFASGSVWAGAATRCAPLEVSCDIDACVVETGAITTGTMRKSASGDRTETRDCPDGQVVTGFVGRSGSMTDQVTLRCQAVEITHDGSDWSADLGTSFTDLTPMGGTGGGPYSRSDCSTDEAAMRIDHRWSSSGYIGFNLACTDPQAVD